MCVYMRVYIYIYIYIHTYYIYSHKRMHIPYIHMCTCSIDICTYNVRRMCSISLFV